MNTTTLIYREFLKHKRYLFDDGPSGIFLINSEHEVIMRIFKDNNYLSGYKDPNDFLYKYFNRKGKE